MSRIRLAIIMNRCFSDISGIKWLNYSQLQDYSDSWYMFNRVEQFNSNVSTQHSLGNKTLPYYTFMSSEDLVLYRQGATLHRYYLGYSTIVQKN